jgi:hypothetical protein
VRTAALVSKALRQNDEHLANKAEKSGMSSADKETPSSVARVDREDARRSGSDVEGRKRGEVMRRKNPLLKRRKNLKICRNPASPSWKSLTRRGEIKKAERKTKRRHPHGERTRRPGRNFSHKLAQRFVDEESTLVCALWVGRLCASGQTSQASRLTIWQLRDALMPGLTSPPSAASDGTICSICKRAITIEQRPSILFLDGSEIHAECYKPLCSICHTMVRLEESKSDAEGKAVHEQCYVQFIRSHPSFHTDDPTLLRERWASRFAAPPSPAKLTR